MALKVVLVTIMLLICLSSYDVHGMRSISREDLEFQRQLQILNKPSVKTIQTKEGEIIDCVDINKQPALDHPLLKNHKIQERPSALPVGMDKTSSSVNALQLRSRREACPAGTVPITRTREKDLIRAKSLLNEHSINISQHASVPGEHRVDITLNNGFKKYGAVAHISIYNFTVAQDQSSSANIWIQDGPESQTNLITAGWKVSPHLNGDGLTRLFTYWTGNDNKNGCYNTACPGFVQKDPQITPNYPVAPSSTYAGEQYDVKIQIYQDRQTGNWWFLVSDDNILVGYWPKELFPYLGDGATITSWGGLAKAGKDGISPPMGNGHFPDGHYRDACFFRQVHYIDSKNHAVSPRPRSVTKYEDNPGCYQLRNDEIIPGDHMQYSFTFGGPGGKCGN